MTAQHKLTSVLDDARKSIAAAPTGWQAVVVVLVTADGNFAIHSRESTDTGQVLRAAAGHATIKAAREVMDALTGPERVEVIRHYMGSAKKAVTSVQPENCGWCESPLLGNRCDCGGEASS